MSNKPNIAKALRNFSRLVQALWKRRRPPVPPPGEVQPPLPPLPPPTPPKPTKPEIPTTLKGQFVIKITNPVDGPPGRNVFFMDELDTIWKKNVPEAERIINEYIRLGGNCTFSGPIWTAQGYDGQYDQTNWIGQADRYAEFLDWLTDKIGVVFVVLCPDAPPYYNSYEINMDMLRRDIKPVLMHPRIQELIKEGRVRGMSQWEQYTYIDAMRPLFNMMTEVFGLCNWGWHNPVWPPHLSPGMGNEEEQKCWDSAVEAGCGWLFLQGNPFQWPTQWRMLDDIIHAPEDTRNDIERTMYDGWDMRRRFNREPGNPWDLGLGKNGQPLKVYMTESSAYYSYKGLHDPVAAGDAFYRASHDAGFTECLDGLEK